MPYTERDLFDAVLAGRTDAIPDALRPVADTLMALRAAPADAELAGESAARADFRALIGSGLAATTPAVLSVPADTVVLPLPEQAARSGSAKPRAARPPRRAARHRRRGRSGSALLFSPAVLFSAAAAFVVVLAIGLTSIVPTSLHSFTHSGSSTSPKPPATHGSQPQTSVPSLNGKGKVEPTPTPTLTPPPPSPATLCSEFFNLLVEHPRSPGDRQEEQALGAALTKLAGGEDKVFGYCARTLSAQNSKDQHRQPNGFPFVQGNPGLATPDQQGKGAGAGSGNQGGQGNHP